MPKNTQKALRRVLRARCPKKNSKSTPCGTFRPGPLSTPVNGGRDRKFVGHPLSLSIVNRGQRINANFFCTKFFENPSSHARPRLKSWNSAPKNLFFCGPGNGEKLFDPRASGRKGQECAREVRTEKFMFMFFFFTETLFSL